MIYKKLQTILLYFVLPVILLAEPFTFSEECYMVPDDTLSPVMTYDLRAEKVIGLNDSSLLMFSDPSTYFEKQYAKYSNEFLSQRDLFERFPDAASLRQQYYYEIAEIPFSNSRFHSLRFHRSYFTGGAHPNSSSEHWIIRKSDGKILTFEDIFKTDAESGLKVLTDKVLLKKFKVKDLNDILFSENYKVSHDIYLVRKGIVFQYDPYEIAPYYVGPIEILLPYGKIHRLMKDF